jgi:anthranilate phosphoribosyltransferase
MIQRAVEKIVRGESLARGEAEAVMEVILTGQASDAQVVALLTALRMKGESVDELVGFATAMRRHARPVFPAGRRADGLALVDTCGTGGDAGGTFNVSTAAAFVVAGAGVRVAKHGNRAISSDCGSADVLEALGIDLEHAPERSGEAIERIGIGFFFAPAVHTAMQHAMRARRELRFRTVFNLLGPLTNPAGATAQVLGVFDRRFLEPMAQAMRQLGVGRGFVVHGADGLDEISLAGETYVAELARERVLTYSVAPEDFGLARAPREAVAGGGPRENAELIRRILAGEKGPPRDIVVANAAAALVAAGASEDFRDAAALAARAIDSGAAQTKLEALVSFSRTKES